MNTSFIEIHALDKIFDMGKVRVRALNKVDLSVDENAFCMIMGPSGSGKSTLLNLIGGLDRPTAGSIRVGQHHLEKLDENALAIFRRKQVGFIFQTFNLIPSMTAFENVIFPMRFARVPTQKRKETAMSLLKQVGLANRAYHKPTELSGGQQQRVSVARALVNQPKLILADEPTGNLDTASGEGIMDLLSSLHQSGTTVVMVTHDTRLIPHGTRVIEILDGQIVNGTSQDSTTHASFQPTQTQEQN